MSVWDISHFFMCNVIICCVVLIHDEVRICKFSVLLFLIVLSHSQMFITCSIVKVVRCNILIKSMLHILCFALVLYLFCVC